MIPFEIETQDIRILFDLLNNPKSFHTGDSVEMPGNARLIYNGMYEKRAIDILATIEFLIEYGDQIATGLIAAWLYDKLKNRKVRIKFNNKEIDFSEKAIEAMLRKHQKRQN